MLRRHVLQKLLDDTQELVEVAPMLCVSRNYNDASIHHSLVRGCILLPATWLFTCGIYTDKPEPTWAMQLCSFLTIYQKSYPFKVMNPRSRFICAMATQDIQIMSLYHKIHTMGNYDILVNIVNSICARDPSLEPTLYTLKKCRDDGSVCDNFAIMNLRHLALGRDFADLKMAPNISDCMFTYIKNYITADNAHALKKYNTHRCRDTLFAFLNTTLPGVYHDDVFDDWGHADLRDYYEGKYRDPKHVLSKLCEHTRYVPPFAQWCDRLTPTVMKYGQWLTIYYPFAYDHIPDKAEFIRMVAENTPGVQLRMLLERVVGIGAYIHFNMLPVDTPISSWSIISILENADGELFAACARRLTEYRQVKMREIITNSDDSITCGEKVYYDNVKLHVHWLIVYHAIMRGYDDIAVEYAIDGLIDYNSAIIERLTSERKYTLLGRIIRACGY